MCLWAWMIAFTSSELTMLSILLQKTPEAVGSILQLKKQAGDSALANITVSEHEMRCNMNSWPCMFLISIGVNT